MSQINAAKRRGPMTRYFNRVREQKMSALRQQLIDSIAAEDAVGHAIHAVYMSIADLDRLRMRNDTADLVLREADQISGACQMLQDLSDDINQSTYKRAAE
jgi:hypothetical protein